MTRGDPLATAHGSDNNKYEFESIVIAIKLFVL